MIGKQAFISDIAKKVKMNKEEVRNVVESFLESLENFIVNGEKIAFQGLFTIDLIEKSSRKGKNPRTGEEIIIPAKKALLFKVSQNLKDKINN